MVSRRPARAARSSRSSGIGRTSRSTTAVKDGSSGSTATASSSVCRRTDAPATKWMLIERPPSAGIGFVVQTWVRTDKLTHEERVKYLPESIEAEKNDDALMPEANQEGGGAYSALQIAAAIASAQPDADEVAAALAASSNKPTEDDDDDDDDVIVHQGVDRAEAAPNNQATVTGPQEGDASVPNPLGSPSLEPPTKRARFHEEPSNRDVSEHREVGTSMADTAMGAPIYTGHDGEGHASAAATSTNLHQPAASGQAEPIAPFHAPAQPEATDDTNNSTN